MLIFGKLIIWWRQSPTRHQMWSGQKIQNADIQRMGIWLWCKIVSIVFWVFELRDFKTLKLGCSISMCLPHEGVGAGFLETGLHAVAPISCTNGADSVAAQQKPGLSRSPVIQIEICESMEWNLSKNFGGSLIVCSKSVLSKTLFCEFYRKIQGFRRTFQAQRFLQFPLLSEVDGLGETWLSCVSFRVCSAWPVCVVAFFQLTWLPLAGSGFLPFRLLFACSTACTFGQCSLCLRPSMLGLAIFSFRYGVFRSTDILAIS